MKKLIYVIAIAVIGITAAFKASPKVYFQKQKGEITFFSKAAVEDITAVNKNSSALLKTVDGSITVKVPIRSFEFEKDLMYNHFLEEKYMWAEKYPEAEFNGTITNLSEIDFDKDGTYNANVKGKMTIRGVEKNYDIHGTITIKDKNLKCNGKFNVTLADHKVPIPKMLTENIAEVVEVTLALDMDLYEVKAE